MPRNVLFGNSTQTGAWEKKGTGRGRWWGQEGGPEHSDGRKQRLLWGLQVRNKAVS